MRSYPKLAFVVIGAFILAYMLDRTFISGSDLCYINKPISSINVLLRMITGR